MTPEPFDFARHGRSPATFGAVLLTWLACALGLWFFDAAGWIIAVVLLFTLPAIWDLWAGTLAGATLTRQGLTWYSGRNRVEIPMDEIDHIRLVTRLDLTVRAAVVLRSGRKLRLPPEATPPHQDFEAALRDHGLEARRHHFSFL